VSAFGQRGVPAHPIRPTALQAVLDDPARRPAALLTRLASGAPDVEMRALADLADHGVPWINGVPSVALAQDKWASLERLREAGLPVPGTALITREDEARPTLPAAGRYVVKPTRGSAGRGVIVGLELEQALHRARAYAEITGSALLQVMTGDGLDRRLFLVGDTLVAAMERRPAAGSGRGSVLYGAEATTWSPTTAQLDLARRAQAALGLDVAGIDLVEDEDGRDVVLEANSCPGLSAIEALTGVDIAGNMADFVLRKLPPR